MTWLYQNEEFTSEMIGKHAGYVYLITDKVNGMKYIGQKQFFSKKKLPPLKGKTRKRTVVTESDWKDYYSSSETIKSLVKEFGGERFQREILRLCSSKSECNYYETKMQFDYDVLFREDFYNGIINCRISTNQIKSWAKTKEI